MHFCRSKPLLLILVALIGTKTIIVQAVNNFTIVYEWKQIEYKFSSDAERSAAISNGTFAVGQIQPVDAQYTFNAETARERIFITTPRLSDTGIPATLSTVTNETREGNPIIDPYPSWSWQINPENCNYNRIVSVFRVWADECNRLWVIDNGHIGTVQACTPQLLAFDLKTDKLLYKYELPYDQYQNVSDFITPTVEVENTTDNCINSWVYVADPTAPSLLVYSLKQNKSWRIQDESFLPNSDYNNYTIEGDSFEVADGILAIALSPKSENRKLFYHSMSNVNESWIYTALLKNESNFLVPYGSPQLFNTYTGRRNQQSCVEGIDQNGNEYFSLLIDVLIVKWDTNTEYTMENFEIIGNNTETMQFPSGLKVGPYKGGPGEGLWFFATAFQQFAAGTLTGDEVNFRLFFSTI